VVRADGRARDPPIHLRVEPSRGEPATAKLAWEEWNVVHPIERLKAGVDVFVDALRAVSDGSAQT
jgi:hypothetical protein